MIDFDFVSPTRVIFSRNAEERLSELLKEYGIRSVLLVYGGGSIKRSGLYDRVIAQLNKADVAYFEIGKIRANPTKESVFAGINILREHPCDLILAVGGGSVIDAAKSMGVGYYYDGDPFDFNLKKAKPTKTIPVGVILTIASAGSEMSNSCVISDDATGVKLGFNNDLIRPLFALENPELTFTVDPYQTAIGFSDIMMHSLERYFGESDSLQLSDEWALDLVKNTMEAGKRALKDPRDYEARAALMLDSSLSHNGYTGIGKHCPFTVHPLEHALSGYRSDIPHGAGVALIFPAWASYVLNKAPGKFAYMAKRLFNLEAKSELETAIMGVAAMKEFFHSVGMPTSFKEVGITENDIPSLVQLASGNGTRVIGHYPQSLNEQDIENIYLSLLS